MAASAERVMAGATNKDEHQQESQFRVVMRRFARHRMAVISLFILLFILLAAFAAPFISNFSYDEIDITLPERPAAPGTLNAEGEMHLLGVDKLGRDLLARVLYAGRISLLIAIFVTLISETVGTLIGAIAGYYGGWVDTIVSRIVEFMVSIPTLPILLILSGMILNTEIASFLPGWLSVLISRVLGVPDSEVIKVVLLIGVLVLFGWLGSARLMRGMALSLRSQDFVESLRAFGASDARIILGHIIPNGLAPILVNASLGLGGVIIAEASISFLGLGIQDTTPTWGNMLSDSKSYMFDHPWLPLVPGIPLVLVSLAINFIGDGLRDALDPKLKR